MKLEEAFGQVLKKERNAKKLSQEELAHRAKLHVASISFYERGIKSPTIHSMFAIAKALDMSASELLGKVEKLDS